MKKVVLFVLPEEYVREWLGAGETENDYPVSDKVK
jgi:hypothetical protein